MMAGGISDKVGVHGGSVLSSLLFIIFTDVLSLELIESLLLSTVAIVLFDMFVKKKVRHKQLKGDLKFGFQQQFSI